MADVVIKHELKMSEATKIVFGFMDGHAEIHTQNMVSRILPDHVFKLSYEEIGLALEGLGRAKAFGEQLKRVKTRLTAQKQRKST